MRLVPVAAAGWGAAALSVLVPGAALPVALGAVAAVVALLGVLGRGPGVRARRTLLVGLLAATVAGGAATAVALAVPERDRVAAWDVSGGRALTAEVGITGKTVPTASGGARADAVLQVLRAGERAIRTSVPVTLLFDALPALDMGGAAVVEGTAFPADPGERAVLVVRVAEVVAATAPTGPAAVTAWLRDRTLAASEALPQPAAGLVPGLAVGDTRGVGAELDAAMKASSLTHLTAVSGANCAIVVGAGFWCAAAVGLGRAARVTVSLLLLSGFVLLVTPEPSVVRAAVMAGVAMLALLLGRAAAGLGVLCLSVAVLVVLDPWLALEVGFALSVAATAALLTLARPLARGLARWMPSPVALAIAVPLSAQLVCGPIIVLIAPQLPTYGVLANLLAAPAAAPATVLGVLGCLASVWPPVQLVLLWLAWVPAAWISGTATVAAGLPAALLPWWEGAPGVIALAAVGGAVAVAVAVRPRGRAGRGAVLASRGVVLLLAGCGVSALALATVVAPATVPGRWSVAACDVGQGDALVLRSQGRVMLVDTGPDPAVLETCLHRLGVGRIDVLVLTHFDLDHAGGLDAVAGRVDVLVHGPVPDGDEDTLADVGAVREVAASTGTTGLLGEEPWRVLWPGPAASVPGNDASVVVEVGGGAMPRTLLLGDLGADAQRLLVASGALRPPYDVVKVAHHGSADQDPALYLAVAAAVGIVPVGAENTYGHPRAEALAMLAAAGTAVARTDRDGLVLVDAGDAGLTWWRERADGAARRERRRRRLRWNHGSCAAIDSGARRQDREVRHPATAVAAAPSGADRAGVRPRGDLRRARHRGGA